MIQAIIFDLGGVLFTNGTKNFSEHLAEKYQVDVEKAKAILDKSKIGNAYRMGKITREAFWDTVKKELELTEHIDVLEQKWIDVYILIEETRDIIFKLSKKYKVYFLSDNVKERVEAIDKKYNFRAWFHGGVSSHEVGIRKPHPDIYTIALKKTGFSADEVLFIDDKENNLTPAKELGMQTLLFETPEKLEKDLQSLTLL
jgi:epoxide hydrolase-like predicted phosphatase